MPPFVGAIIVGLPEAQAALRRLLAAGQDLTPMMRDVAGILHDEVEQNFAEEGRPKWTALAPSTLRKRAQERRDARILQYTGQLAASITPQWGRNYALVGTNKVYAAIQQFGGVIQRASYSTRVRLATTAGGELVRQGKNGKLAKFAKDGAKRARTSWAEVKAYEVRIPARPFLAVTPTGEANILARIQAGLRAAAEG